MIFSRRKYFGELCEGWHLYSCTYFQMQHNDTASMLLRCNPDILNPPYPICFRISYPSISSSVLLGIVQYTALISDDAIADCVSRIAARDANTFLPRYRRSISTTRVHEARTTREPYPRPVTTSPISGAYTRRISRTCNKQCRSCAQWRRNAKNRWIRRANIRALQAPARILLLKMNIARINDGQIHHHKVKSPQ